MDGSLAELKGLLPPATVEYVQQQPTLEDVFLAVVGTDSTDSTGGRTPGSAPTSKEQP